MGGFAGGAWDAGGTSASDLYAPPSPAGEPLAVITGIIGLIGSTPGNPGVYNTGPKPGFMAGGTLGCNYQAGWAVFGIEGEGGYLHMSSTQVVPGGPALGTPPILSGVYNTTVGNWYGLLAARFGYASNNALFYVKGGAVWTSVNSTVGSVCNLACGQDNLNAAGSLSDVAGWALGGGFEYAFSRNWSAKAEALYFDFDKQYLACGPSTAIGGLMAVQCSNERLGRIMTVKLGLNYKFDWAGLTGAH